MESPLVQAQRNASSIIDKQIEKKGEHKHFTSGSQVNVSCYEEMNNAMQQEENKKCILWSTNISQSVIYTTLCYVYF